MIDSISRGRTSSRLRRFAPIFAAVSVAAALVAGCSSSSDDTGTTTAAPPAQLPDGAQIVAECARTTQTLQWVHFNLSVSNVPNLPVETISADVTNQPQGAGQAIGDAKVRLKPEAEFTDTKFLVYDKTLYAGDGTKYSKVGPAEQIYDPGVILDKDKGLANVIAQIQNPKAEAREKIDGIDTVKISGTINGSVIDPVVPKAGDGVGSLPITVWIKDVAPPTGTTSTLPSEAASPGTGPNLVKAVVTKDSGTISVVLSNWAKEFTVPKVGG